VDSLRVEGARAAESHGRFSTPWTSPLLSDKANMSEGGEKSREVSKEGIGWRIRCVAHFFEDGVTWAT